MGVPRVGQVDRVCSKVLLLLALARTNTHTHSLKETERSVAFQISVHASCAREFSLAFPFFFLVSNSERVRILLDRKKTYSIELGEGVSA